MKPGQNIKIYVACHEEKVVPDYPFLVPVQVGASLTETVFNGFVPDNSGLHISGKNRSYCELTAQYWAWKNEIADFYGFFHYRRFLYPKLRGNRPYQLCGGLSKKVLDKYHFADLSEVVNSYDLVLPKPENMWVSVEKHYSSAPFHHKKDLDLVKEMISQKYPEYTVAMGAYFAQTSCYFGNIFIMKRELFHKYMSWLFGVLWEFDEASDVSGYNVQEKRVNGYLAERLLGVFVYRLMEVGQIRVLHLPRLHFEEDVSVGFRKNLVNFALPPGSRRRAVVKGSVLK